MGIVQRQLSASFRQFFNSSKAAPLLLTAFTLASVSLANSPWSAAYLGFWHLHVAA